MRPAGRFVQRQAHGFQLVKRKCPVIPPQPVEAVLPDIRQHLRLQGLVRQPEEQEPACLGRRNVQKLIVQQRDLRAKLGPQQRRLRLQPFLQRRVDRRPREADDARQTRDLLRLAPAGKREEHVRPHHQPERIVRMLRGELAQRVDSIAWPFAPQLQIANLEAVQPSDRQLRQREARLRVRRAVRQRLVRRNSSRNDNHAFQPQRRAALRRRQPMPFVRRVERPAVDPNVRHRTVLCLTMFCCRFTPALCRGRCRAQLFATKERYRCGLPLAGTHRPTPATRKSPGRSTGLPRQPGA